MRRKIVLALLILLAVALVLAQSWETIRFAIIRATVGYDLPGWLQAFLWGWW